MPRILSAVLLIAGGLAATGCCSAVVRGSPPYYTHETVAEERCTPIDCFGEAVRPPPPPRCGCVDLRPPR